MDSPSEMDPIQARFRDQLIIAGGHAVLFEVNLRKLCEKHTQSRRFAYGDLEKKVLAAVLGLFGAHLTDDEAHLLTESVQLRNKVTHAQFEKLDGILRREFQIELRPAVRRITVPSDGSGILESLETLTAGGGTNVLGQHQKKEAGTFAWELQVLASGALGATVRLLHQAIDLIDRLVRIENP